MTKINNRLVLAENIKKQLRKRGMKPKELAIASGIPYSTLLDWIHGRKYPRVDTLQQLCDYLKIDKADLTEPENTPYRLVKQQNVQKYLEMIADYSSDDLDEIIEVITRYHSADSRTKTIVKMALEVE